MAEPKAYESERLTSGVTWKWKKTISDYPASEWTLTYYLRKDGATATSFSAAADGDVGSQSDDSMQDTFLHEVFHSIVQESTSGFYV